MKKFTILALAFVASLVSCSKESNLGEGGQVGEKITIGLSDGNVSYSPLAVKSIEADDLVAVQIYEVSGSTETPYANGLFTDFDGLTFDGYIGKSYKVVASLVKDAKNVITKTNDQYGKPFCAAVSSEFDYSSAALADIASSTATLDGEDYTTPNIDRYHAEATKSITSSDATIALFMKRVSFGIKVNLDSSVTDDITIKVAGAPEVVVAVADAADFIIYTHSDLAAAYSADESTTTYSEDLDVEITSDGVTIYDETETFYRNMCAKLSCSLLGDSSFDVDFDSPFEDDYYTISFEGDEWDALIPTTQVYGDKTMYSNTQYVWSDAKSGLSGSINDGGWTYTYEFSSGGLVVSNYTNAIEGASYDQQLSVPIGGNNDSSNFVMTYSDSSMLSNGKPAALTFAEAKVIDHLYLANASIMLNTCINGDSYVEGGLKETDWFSVTFTGYDAEGAESCSVVTYMAKNGVEEMDWKRVNLSSLGAVSKVTIVCDSSIKGANGNCVPGYIALDDICVILK